MNTVLCFYSAPSMEAEYCDEPVCLSVCLFPCISQEPHFHASVNFRWSIPAAVALFSYRGVGVMLRTPGLVDDVMVAHNRPGNGCANRASTQ